MFGCERCFHNGAEELGVEGTELHVQLVGICIYAYAYKRSMLTKRNIADIFLACVLQTRDTLELERRVVAEEHLRGILKRYDAASGIDEFLAMVRILHQKRLHSRRTCRKTLPKIRSVSSRNTVLKITVTRSQLALM